MRRLLITIAVLAGCDPSGSSPPDAPVTPVDADFADGPTFQSISVTPASITMVSGGTVQLVVTGHYAGGLTYDLTFRAGFESSDPAVATVTNAPGLGGDRGQVVGQGVGTATITSTVLGSPATTVITVTP